MAKDKAVKEQKPQTDFLETLIGMRAGKVASDINQKFNAVLEGVIGTGGKGELTLKIKVKPAEFGEGGAVVQVQASHEIKSRVPELVTGPSTFFVSRDGTLSRSDPAQAEMFEPAIPGKETE